jgi:hypothetical protein
VAPVISRATPSVDHRQDLGDRADEAHATASGSSVGGFRAADDADVSLSRSWLLFKGIGIWGNNQPVGWASTSSTSSGGSASATPAR